MWKYLLVGLGASVIFFLSILIYEYISYAHFSAPPDFYLLQCLTPCIFGGFLASFLGKRFENYIFEKPTFSLFSVFLTGIMSLIISIGLIILWMFI